MIVNGRLAICSNSNFNRKVEDEDTLAEISEVISETSEYFDESSADFYASWAFLVTYDMVAAFNNISQSGEVSCTSLAACQGNFRILLGSQAQPFAHICALQYL